MSSISAVPRRPTLLVILDGFGVNPSPVNNAIAMANTPNLDAAFAANNLTVLEACGAAVGLPSGQMGNSEVGHLTIGTGTILRQDLVRISDAVKDGSIQENAALQAAILAAKNTGRPIHLTGLVSDGGIHSHIDHLVALVAMCGDAGVRPLVHMITDGRDTAPECATKFLPVLEAALADANGAIVTVSGRYYAMDRDKRWDRVEQAWLAMRLGEGKRAATAEEAIKAAWSRGESDEFVLPTVTDAFEAMEDNDQVIFFNFRNDRPRELSQALAVQDFDGFDRQDRGLVQLTTLTSYSADFDFPVAFTKDVCDVTLAEVLSSAGVAQFHCAETEKYPHVTFFFNGGREEPYTGEERVLINSPKVATYDLQPEMSASDVADATLDALGQAKYGFIVVNFANGDMVGHTGVTEAAVQAIETLNTQVQRLLDAADEHGYSVIITADHGNCDMMVDPVTQGPHTQHTTFPVPCMIRDQSKWVLATGGGLSNIAPTVLQLMGLEQPAKMTSSSLLLEEIHAG